jgi:hypothetical protein
MDANLLEREFPRLELGKTNRPAREALVRKLKQKSIGVPLIPKADCQCIAVGISRRREGGWFDFLAVEPDPNSAHRVTQGVTLGNAYADRKSIIVKRHDGLTD